MGINCQLRTEPEAHVFINNELVRSSHNEIITWHCIKMSELHYQDVSNNFYTKLLSHCGKNINTASAAIT